MKPSTNILRQAKSIHGLDQETLMAHQMFWINQYNRREAFLKDLREELDRSGVTGKARSRSYSNSVIAFDKTNRLEGWSA